MVDVSPTSPPIGRSHAGRSNRWLQWYDADHVDGLRTTIAEGPEPKLTELQRATLTVLIERGPIAAGYQSGVWTGPMIGVCLQSLFIEIDGELWHVGSAPVWVFHSALGLSDQKQEAGQAD